jgi:nucleoside-diphosphate-sugar epimerase
MKIVITGGSGFLGQRVARELLKRGQVNGPDGNPLPIRELVLLDIAPPLNGLSDATVGYAVGDAANPKFVADTSKLLRHSKTDRRTAFTAMRSGSILPTRT